MKKVRVEDAIGMSLCHDITAMYDGFKGAYFKRGHIIEKKDVQKLLEFGKKNIFVWEENENEIHEEDAAIRLSKLANVNGATYSKPSEGKILLEAEIDGLWVIDMELLKQVNLINDITIATLPNHYHIKKGDKLASMRIVPLVTKNDNIEMAEKLCKNKQLYNLYEFVNKKVGVIITGSEVYSGKIKDKFEPVCREKLKKFPAEIVDILFCDDDESMLKEKTYELIDKNIDILIYTGGMSVDPDDITPSVIKNIGADIISYGVPSQPGNMTLVAYKNNISIIGVPGAAISLPTTTFDVLLPQLFTNLKITKEDLLNLASGGLCQLCKVCHFPNCTFGRY